MGSTLSGPSARPGARCATYLTYDVNSHCLILFGGDVSGGAARRKNDIWRYSIVNGTWTYLGEGPTGMDTTFGPKGVAGPEGVFNITYWPSGRMEGGATFWTTEQSIVVLGGDTVLSNGNSGRLTDVWRGRLGNIWTTRPAWFWHGPLIPTVVGSIQQERTWPQPSDGAYGVYVPSQNSFYLFGGRVGLNGKCVS